MLNTCLLILVLQGLTSVLHFVFVCYCVLYDIYVYAGAAFPDDDI